MKLTDLGDSPRVALAAAPVSLAQWLRHATALHEREIVLGLERVRAVWVRMGPPSAPPRRVVTVAGTNGKGSCVAVLEAVARAAGWRVGAYTSPHLLSFNERVRLDGRPVDDAALCRGMDNVERARRGVHLTWFEFTTLAALDALWREGLDLAVLEVGLGGRLDAVNLIDAELAVLAPVMLDHCDWLGEDRESIGAEKAGVFRAGRPVVCADADPPRSALERAGALGCPWHQRGREFAAGDPESRWDWHGAKGRRLRALAPSPLPVESLSAALEAAALLDCWPADATLRECLASLRLAGRWQAARLGPATARLDIAHNPAAAAYVARRWQALAVSGQRVVLFGALSDKDLDGMISALSECADHWLFADLPGVARAADAGSLARRARRLGVRSSRTVPDVAGGLRALAGSLAPDDSVLVTGSCHTVGAALRGARGFDGQATIDGHEAMLG